MKATDSSKIPVLVLFDMDGTLVWRTTKGDANAPHPIFEAAMKLSNCTNIQRRGLVTDGMTDISVIQALWRVNGIESPFPEPLDEQSKAMISKVVTDQYARLLESGKLRYQRLPFVNELLKQLRDNPNKVPIAIGMLTGNVEDAVPMKLKHAGIELDPFTRDWPSGRILGAYGSDSPVRSDLVEYACRRYAQMLGLADQSLIPRNRVVIVGDTPKDIACAHSNGARCIAVCTGVYSAEQLKDADVVVPDFADLDRVINAILNGDSETKPQLRSKL